MNVHEAAAKALLMRSRSRKELQEFLRRKGFDECETEDALNELEECGYLSDERFCAEYMRYAFGKKWGKMRVFKELKSKGVSHEIIDNVYSDFLYEHETREFGEDAIFSDNVETDEYERAADVARRMVTDAESINDKIRARIARRLAGYGYATDVIYRVLGDLNEL